MFLTEGEEYFTMQDVFTQFTEAYSKNYQQVDVQKKPESYENLCDKFLERIKQQVRSFTSEYKHCIMWEAERNTWNLISQLQLLRSTTRDVGISPKSYQTERDLFNRLAKENHDFAEALIVRKWLQEKAPPFNPVETQSELWGFTRDYIMFTLKDTESNRYLDPDGPYRNGIPLHHSDQAHEKELAKSIYEYLRRGQFSNAFDICEKNCQYFRAAAIGGYVVYGENENQDEESINGYGNINRPLTRAIFYRTARENNLDIYERAYNAVLCGDVENVLPVCVKWEDYVWAYYNGMIECKQEQYFNLKGRNSVEVLDEELQVPTKFVDFSPEDIFRAVEAQKVDKYPIMELFHKIQKLYILNQPSAIINVLKEELTNDQLRQNDNDVYCYILRFAAYFVLYLRELKLPIPENEGMEGDEIIKLYTELLIEYQQNKIIALYASELPKKLSIETYAAFLKNNTESRDKRRILYILAENHGLDVKSITRATFDLIFNEPDVEDQHGLTTSLRRRPIPSSSSFLSSSSSSSLPSLPSSPLPSSPLPSSINLVNDLDPPIRETTSPVSNQDLIKIRGLEWLTFNNEQVIEAFDRANALCRRFFVKGKLNAVKNVFYATSNQESTLSSYKIGDDDDKLGYEYSVINEYAFYYNMTEFFSKNEEWAKISREKSLKKETEFDTRIREATEAVEKLFEKFTNALISDDDDKGGITGRYNIEDEERKKELNLIKDIYVPNIVLRLHHIYEKTRDGNQEYLNKSFHLANLIADDNQALYVHFLRSKKLPILIECIKNSYLEIIRTNPRDIFLY
ncbi:hypothetical protein Glove_645g11 [Diversispora epigaea]|uniref:Nuclear pore complex protein n=1 Tax=Diversispora epigaea TaxID=1348612 RepID=A0A397G766_9GLOM|nr:hypothetical protein Glove_645g11 [Diversispora epigaea]